MHSAALKLMGDRPRLPNKLDNLMDAIEELGFTVETFTNVEGTRFCYELWYMGRIVKGLEMRTWGELELMYQYIFDVIIPVQPI